jgi:hypothetical protein
MHHVTYARYPSYQKIIATVRSQLFCLGMNKYVVDYIDMCMECQRVKVEHRHLMGLLQPLPITEKKWEVVTIKQHDLIMVVVDNLTKVAHFMPVNMTHTTINIVEIYMNEIDRLHGIPKKIVSNKDTKFTLNFWRGLFKVLVQK